MLCISNYAAISLISIVILNYIIIGKFTIRCSPYVLQE